MAKDQTFSIKLIKIGGLRLGINLFCLLDALFFTRLFITLFKLNLFDFNWFSLLILFSL